MKQMAFMGALKDYLRENGHIYTIRKYKMSGGKIEVEGVGICNRTRLEEIEVKEDLVAYVDQSGFDSLGDWWRKVKWYIPEDGPYYLYKVEVE